MKLIVSEKVERLDKYIKDNTEYSRNAIDKMLDDKLIKVNGEIKKPSYKVKENDVIEFLPPKEESKEIIPQKMDLDIIYEDDDIMIINKPSGLVVHPGDGNRKNTLVNGLLNYTKNLSDINGPERPGIVHRIDKDTSGLIIIAKTNEAHLELAKNFKEHKNIKREYIALLCGNFPHDSATIDAPIGRSSVDRKKMAVTATNSKNAVTHMEVLKRYDGYTLVKLVLETGRTHQIRVHMNYIGYPVYNDPVYNTKKCTEFGQFLHSYKITLTHPITKKELTIKVDPPLEFTNFLDQLEEIPK